MTFLEAAACGKPVVGGRSGGAAEAVQDGVTGLLVDATNVDAVTASVRDLLVGPDLRRQMGEDARRRAVSEFNWNSRSRELHNITRSIALNLQAAEVACVNP